MGELLLQMFPIRDVIIADLWVTRPLHALITSACWDEDQTQELDPRLLPIFDGRASIAVRYAVQSRGQGTPWSVLTEVGLNLPCAGTAGKEDIQNGCAQFGA